MTRKIDRKLLTQNRLAKMKSIRQQVEVSFHAVEVSDVVKLLSIMDATSFALDEGKELQLKVGDNAFARFSEESRIVYF